MYKLSSVGVQIINNGTILQSYLANTYPEQTDVLDCDRPFELNGVRAHWLPDPRGTLKGSFPLCHLMYRAKPPALATAYIPRYSTVRYTRRMSLTRLPW